MENLDVIKRKKGRVAVLTERLEQCCGSHASSYGGTVMSKNQQVNAPEPGPSLEGIQDQDETDDREDEGVFL